MTSFRNHRVVDTVESVRRALCPDCETEREFVDEPMVSGFRGYVCLNNECPRDS